MEKENIHSGHRERMKKRFLENGLDSLEDHEVLELLLYYSIARRDTNPIAHMLLDKFGSLSGVLDAELDELVQIKGISEHSGLLMKLIPQLLQRYAEDKNIEKSMNLSTTRRMMDFAKTLFLGKKHEEFYVVCMDSNSRLLGYKKMSEGSLDATMLDVRKLMLTIINFKSKRVFVTHNHPSGTPLPSTNDIESTKNIFSVLSGMDIIFDDHIIVSDKGMTSMASLGMI